jgi:putative FmdB family regulatory protein
VPTYDYQCRSCGLIDEVVHSMFEEGPTSCERCGGELRRVFHPTGIIFKGGGFYKTDSRSSSEGVAGSSNGSSAGSGDGSAPATPSAATGSSDKGSAPKSSGTGAGKGESGSGSG